jgi:arylformamidase
MIIYDISRFVQEAPLYPGSPPVSVSPLTSFAQGDGMQTSLLVMDSHAGTHADAPSHFLPNAPGIEGVGLERGYGPCRLISVLPGAPVTPDALDGALLRGGRLAIRGLGRSYLSPAAAQAIARAGIVAVVTDAVSVGPPDNEAQIHRTLLSAGILIIENATFEGVPDGDYLLCAFPIKIKGCDGAPVRAVLIQEHAPPRLRYARSEMQSYRIVGYGFEVQGENNNNDNNNGG